MRIHCLENVDKALQFLKEQKVHLENMGSHDIVDGNHRLTLGLVWTIILRFQVPTWWHLACAPRISAAAPTVTAHVGGLEPHTLGQGTPVIKQDRGQRGYCQTPVANSLWPGLLEDHIWGHKGLEILQMGTSPQTVLELHLGSGHQSTPLPQTLLTSLKRTATQLLFMF